MSILIKGMEMPKNCHSCPMYLMRFCQARDRELSEQEIRPNAKRPEDCPLVEIPPHGRLIDADAYKREMKDCRMAFWDEVLDSMPVVIPASEEVET